MSRRLWLLAFDLTLWLLCVPPRHRGSWTDWRWRLHMWTLIRLSEATDFGAELPPGDDWGGW